MEYSIQVSLEMPSEFISATEKPKCNCDHERHAVVRTSIASADSSGKLSSATSSSTYGTVEVNICVYIRSFVRVVGMCSAYIPTKGLGVS